MASDSIKKHTAVLILFIAVFMAMSMAAAFSTESCYAYGALKTGKVTASKLNIRSGAGTKYSIRGAFSKGKTFSITGTAKDKSGVKWYRLKYKSKNSYVSSRYVKIIKFKVAAVSNLKATVKAKDGLNVRKGPGTKYKSLWTIANGKTVNVTGKAKDTSGVYWYRLTFGGKTGYISSKYVKTKSTAAAVKTASVKNTESKTTSSSTAKTVTFKVGTVTASGGLNVRKGAGTGYSILTVLDKGVSVEITGSKKASNGKTWYIYRYSSGTNGYISSDYVKVKDVKSDSDFESYMTKQGFPDSYKSGLRVLHAAHPKWVFKAVKTGYNWSSALSKESVIGRNLVSSSSPSSYRSKESGSYNSKTGAWTRFDGSWYAANKTVIAYYMDPRNFLTESGIYQFMSHEYNSKSQNAATVKAVIKGSFMEGKNPGGGYSSYQSLINAAGKNTGVNPNVLAAMIIQEQGWNGSSLCLGKYSGYKGYYNFFNIGAYTTSSMNAVQRGLWYAKRQGWNTPYKAIKGGAKFYASDYVSAGQNTYYTKKFNVKNGLSKVGTHQYMTNVAAAAGEGSLVKRAYSSCEYPVVFEIPVYGSMPSSACPLP